jgi:hypothetical protein
MNNYECVGCGCEFDGSPVAGTGCTHEGRRYGACEECVEGQPEEYDLKRGITPLLRVALDAGAKLDPKPSLGRRIRRRLFGISIQGGGREVT